MNLLKLDETARQRIGGAGHWIRGHRHVQDDGGEDAYCAMGAIESALDIREHSAERHSLARKLIMRMGHQLGVPSYQDWRRADEKNKSEDEYVYDCVDAIETFNDEKASQRGVQGIFRRVATILKREYAERRRKRLVRLIKRDAIAGATKMTAKKKEPENV